MHTVLGSLTKLTANGSTNLWDGLRTGIEILKKAEAPNRLSSLFLFTDGLPNICPPRGIFLLTSL